MALAKDLFKNFVCSLRRVVHTLALVVNEAVNLVLNGKSFWTL